MSIYLKDNSMILNTPETVDTVVAPVMPYTFSSWQVISRWKRPFASGATETL